MTVKTKEPDRAYSQNTNRSNIQKVDPLPYADTYKRLNNLLLKYTVKSKMYSKSKKTVKDIDRSSK